MEWKPGWNDENWRLVFGVPGFWSGLAVGCVVSVGVWVGGWNFLIDGGFDNSTPLWTAMWVVPLAKLVSGLTCVAFPSWRLFGGGILLSLPLGIMIFFGNCAGRMT
jgi:hypothetical protein